MIAGVRGIRPLLLRKYGKSIAREYMAKRIETPNLRFHWPHRENQSLLDVVRIQLSAMTDARCAYCDGYPIDATGEDQVDHFRPKTRREFYHLVCAWKNLFLTCSACNKAKGDKWDEALLRPDVHEFTFLRYFSYRTDNGKLEPNRAASTEDQARASRTIEILDLNRPGACVARQRTVRRILASRPDDDLIDLDYRFLIPLCRNAVSSGRQ